MRLQEWTMEEQEQLIHFMTTNTWPYDGNSHPGRNIVEKAIEDGGYESDEVKTFWVENEEGTKIGIVKIYDLQERIPLFDLRIANEWRGHGYGPQALKLVANYVFGLPGQKIRLEGHTRQDNLAMRKTFERAGFVKEAHLRNAWFSPKENSYYDAITYGITREDYAEGTTTPVIWEDRERPTPQIPDFSEVFESERLIIRAPQMGDETEVWQAVCQSHTALHKWIPFARSMPTLEETKEDLRQATAEFITRKKLRYHIYLKGSGDFIGSVGLYRIDWAVPKVEIGYWLATKFEGQGYMTEAVEKITTFAFKELGVRRVEIRCDEKNLPSRAVAERLSFSLEGVLQQNSRGLDDNSLRNTCIYAKIE